MTPVEQIKDKLDIVTFIRQYVELKPAGRNFKANCPFHKEKTPSFMVSPERQTWHCFGTCSEGGDIFKFLMKYENIEFYEALKILAEKAGIELRRISPVDQKQFGVLYDINESAKDFFKKNMGMGKRASEYLKERGLSEETIKEFEIGFAPNNFEELTLNLINLGYDVKDVERSGLNFKSDRGGYVDRFRGRIMFPIYNHFGKVVGFSGRILPELDKGESGKYINSPETPIFNKSKILYGFHKAKNYIREQKFALLVEGQMDFLMAYQDGVKNTVATSGTALTEDHLVTLRRQAEELVLCFDADEAGIKAAERGIDMANNLDFNVKVLVLSGYKDPAEMVVKNPGALANGIKSAKPAMEFYFDRYLSGNNNSSSELKKGVRAILVKIKNLASPVERSFWIKELSNKTSIDEKTLNEESAQLQSPVIDKENSSQLSVADRQMPVSLSRLELIAERVLSLAMQEGAFIPEVKDYYNYLPEGYQCVYRHLANGEKFDNPLVNKLIDDLTMKSGLEEGESSQDDISKEFFGLLKHLKLEALSRRKTEVAKEIKEAERSKNEEKLRVSLKQFDEISKMLQNSKE